MSARFRFLLTSPIEIINPTILVTHTVRVSICVSGKVIGSTLFRYQTFGCKDSVTKTSNYY